MSNQTFFELCQTTPEWNGGGVDVLWKFSNEDDAQDAADEVNRALSERGIPSSISCAFVP